jgi:quercetin dioxygenase-like cupin family protein
MPAEAKPAIIRRGTSPAYLVAGQVVHVLATKADTAGAFGLVAVESPRDSRPIPLHWHAREHDTWYCTRGRMTVWGNGQGRALYPGDFAYVPPGQVHAYQCTGTNNAFFGLVAPGGWEAFFGDAGSPWRAAGMPPAGSQPFDIGRMIAAQAKHGVNRVEDPYPPVTDGADDTLPGHCHSYFLQAGHGERRTLWGTLVTKLIGAAETNGLFSMHVLEAPHGTRLPTRAWRTALEAIHVIAGSLHVTIAEEEAVLTEGDTAIVPAGTMQSAVVITAAARWLSCVPGPDADVAFGRIASPHEAFSYPIDPPDGNESARVAQAAEIIMLD